MQMKLDLRYHKKGLEIQFGLCAMFTFEYIRLSIMWREKQTFWSDPVEMNALRVINNLDVYI